MTDIMEARRKAFETSWEKVTGMVPFRYSQGMYVSDSALIAWNAFNAALDSVCIELPEPDTGYSEEGYHGQVTMLISCEEAIERAGLKVKP